MIKYESIIQLGICNVPKFLHKSHYFNQAYFINLILYGSYAVIWFDGFLKYMKCMSGLGSHRAQEKKSQE